MERRSAIKPVRFLPALGMMAVIFLVSAQPGDQIPLPDFLNFDKAWHLLEYGLLAAACLFALHPLPHRTKTKTALGVILFVILYGISDEFHQSFVPLRTVSGADVIADGLGATIAAGLWWWRKRP